MCSEDLLRWQKKKPRTFILLENISILAHCNAKWPHVKRCLLQTPLGSVSLCHSAVPHADCSAFRSDTALHQSSSPRDVHFSYSKYLEGGRGRFESSAAETCNKNKDNAIIDEFSVHHGRHTKYHFYAFQSTQSLNSLNWLTISITMQTAVLNIFRTQG